jgi:2-oxoisovalerate dehydrogenase E1 component
VSVPAAQEFIDAQFVARLGELDRHARPHGSERDLSHGISLELLLGLFDSQLGSRHLDLAARWLRSLGEGFYTIGSSGHEGNAAVAAALRPTDPALLHYRSGGFYLERARQVPEADGLRDGLRDVLLGLVASVDDPISGGRHKVFGRHELSVIPQTSTIASHLPRALGVAFSLPRAAKLGVTAAWPSDSVVTCSFGDASANHSTATGAINAAIQVGARGLPVPLLFVCEDNGIGISVPTPQDWIAKAYGRRPGLEYFTGDGCDLPSALAAAQAAVAFVRKHRKPAFLHLATVRLMGHAGSDLEAAYRTHAQIAAEASRDPVLRTALLLVEAGIRSPREVLGMYEDKRQRVREVALECIQRPRLKTREQVMSALAPRSPEAVRSKAVAPASPARRSRAFGSTLPEAEPALTLAQSINRALLDVMAAEPGAVLFGEDVAVKGGVYGVTRGIAKRMGAARVFDTILDEQTVLGLALGAGLSGLLPIPEIQYLAYLHNAADQLRGEAATLQFFSSGQYQNPMVLRIAGYAYQKGFGGHFHNDNAVGALRDSPGIVIASPSRPEDAAAMLRTCVASARVDGTVCVFLEPIALYHTKDLHEEGDGGWTAPYAGPEDWADTHVPVGRAATHGDGQDLTIITFGNGLFMSLRVAKQLRHNGIGVRVVDLRWLAPLPVEDIEREATVTGKVLVVDETRRTGGVSEAVVTALVDVGFAGTIRRVASHDSFIPLGDAALQVLISEEDIHHAAMELLRG